LTDTPAPNPEPQQQETVLESLASICVVLAVGLFLMTFVFRNFEIPSGSMQNTLLIGDHLVVDRISLAPPSHWAPFVHYREVSRGDIIVFLKPNPESPDLILVKRAIAVPGDHIHLRQGIVYLNGVAQDEPYAINPTAASYIPYRDNFPSDLTGLSQEASDDFALRGDCRESPAQESPAQDQPCIDQKARDKRTMTWAALLPKFIQGDDLVVPPGVVFAMGDNRTQSLDGRFWGFVPRENILGRPMFVYWSFQTPPDQIDKSGIGNRIAFIGHILLHLFDQTRWNRTLHIIR